MRHRRYLAAGALLCALLVALTAMPTTTVRARVIPPLAPTATATATSAPTSTPRPSAATIPSPTPTPGAQTVGASGDTTCSPDALHIPIPFSGGFCVNWFTVVGQAVGSIWHGVTGYLERAINSLSAAIMGPLTHTSDPTANGDLTQVSGTITNDALQLFTVLLMVAAIWVARPGLFGTMSEGLSLLYRAALVMGVLKGYDTLVRLWVALCNALTGDIGSANVTNFGHSAAVLIFAPVLLFLAGLERAVANHLFAFAYEVGPLAIVMAVWPPTLAIAAVWLRTFAYLSLLGAAYALMAHTIVALTNSQGGIWGTVTLLGGLLVLALVPALVAALLNVTAHTVGHSFAGIAASAGF